MATRVAILDPIRLEREILGLPVKQPRVWDSYMSERKSSSSFSPSPMQQGFFNWINKGTGSAILEAVAGAGKTTTLIEALKLMDGSIFFGAYNKSAAEEIKAKAAKSGINNRDLRMGTVHSAGYGACRRMWPKVTVDDKKTQKIMQQIAADAPDMALVYAAIGQFISKMVSFGKQFLVGLPSQAKTWEEIADHFSMDETLPEGWQVKTALGYVEAVYTRSRAWCPEVIDFDDMIYAPLAYGLRLFQNDWVLLDEVQDINPAREELAYRMLKRNGRFVGVGDDCQAIYGFTGAGGGGIARIAARFNCVMLPLTVTYRCPKAVVAYVHQWVSHIQAAPEAIDGAVRVPSKAVVSRLPGEDAEEAPWFVQELPASSSAILCRKTAPLIKTAFGMLRKGIPCRVEGRDIGKGLIALISRWKVQSLDRLEVKLDAWLAREVAAAQAKQSDRREQEAQDRYDTLVVFMERCRAKGKNTIAALIEEIDALFGDNVVAEGVVTLCSGHKAKGREWPVVYWLQTSDRRPRKDWEATEERNVKYVIGTRAQVELVIVPED